MIDVDAEPDRWAWLERTGSRDAWKDMQEFALRQRDRALRDRLTHAIEVNGAFRRFRDFVHGEGLAVQWQIFAADRRWGASPRRARRHRHPRRVRRPHARREQRHPLCLSEEQQSPPAVGPAE